jgi:hypothetical protein
MPPKDNPTSKSKPFKPVRPKASTTAPSAAATQSTTTAVASTLEPQSTLDDPDRPGIPPALLTTLLHQFMSDEMRISKGADKAVGKYMETFVREAVARAAFERAGEKELGGGFMEVSFLSLFLILLQRQNCAQCHTRTGEAKSLQWRGKVDLASAMCWIPPRRGIHSYLCVHFCR